MEGQIKYLKYKITKSKAHIACNLLKESSSEDLQAYFTEQMHLKDFSAAQKLNAEIAALNWVLDLM